MANALEDCLRSAGLGLLILAGLFMGYRTGMIGNNHLLLLMALGGTSYYLFMQQKPVGGVHGLGGSSNKADGTVHLVENMVCQMLMYRTTRDPSLPVRVETALRNGMFRDYGLESPARHWIENCDKAYVAGVHGGFVDTVEAAEFAYAASGSDEDRVRFEHLCTSADTRIREAALRAVHRRKMAEQNDGTGALLAMSGTLKHQHTSLLS